MVRRYSQQQDNMRIVTRSDFDSVVCAVLLYEALDIQMPVKWAEPSEIQKGLVEIHEGDIIANLPYAPNCSLWFDHHFSNQGERSFTGAFRMAPSAAGIIFGYYRDRFHRDYTELVQAADKIDSADLTQEEVLYPERYPYILLSMTISSQNKTDEAYWNHLVDLLRVLPIHQIMEDKTVKIRCVAVIRENKAYRTHLKNHTKCHGHIAVTDFRTLNPPPAGNRFLVYSLFPECSVQVKIRLDTNQPDMVMVSVGHSIFNRTCKVNVGQMLSEFEGGGHSAAGACKFHASKAEHYIHKILDILLQNDDLPTGGYHAIR
jgi:hypothetical protein